MAVFELFSKRQNRLQGKKSDVYAYDNIPQKLRVQIVHIISDTVGRDVQYRYTQAQSIYEFINNTLCREYGLFKLTDAYNEEYRESVLNFFLNANHQQAIDVIELAFKVINDDYIRSSDYVAETKLKSDEAISELNERFKENAVGFQFISNQLIRIDSEFTHSEIIKPVLNLLLDKEFKGANEEFLSAHEHYRNKRYKETLIDALKSFESVLKTICAKRKWAYKQNDTAKNLIDICFQKGLIPDYLQSQFTALRSLLESGMPTVRNKLGGHGQGPSIINVPEHIARLSLNLVATYNLFLIELDNDQN